MSARVRAFEAEDFGPHTGRRAERARGSSPSLDRVRARVDEALHVQVDVQSQFVVDVAGAVSGGVIRGS
jgi:hypothetical protein